MRLIKEVMVYVSSPWSKKVLNCHFLSGSLAPSYSKRKLYQVAGSSREGDFSVSGRLGVGWGRETPGKSACWAANQVSLLLRELSGEGGVSEQGSRMLEQLRVWILKVEVKKVSMVVNQATPAKTAKRRSDVQAQVLRPVVQAKIVSRPTRLQTLSRAAGEWEIRDKS